MNVAPAVTGSSYSPKLGINIVLNVVNITAAITFALGLGLSTATSATTVIGAGNVGTTSNDTNPRIQAINLADEVTLAAGTYRATSFNTEFTGGPTGLLAPFLVADVYDGAGRHAIPVAYGTILNSFTTNAGFQSYAFGGADTFTLSQTTVIAAAIDFTRVANDMPVGYIDGGSTANQGPTYILYSVDYSPVIGQILTGAPGGGADTFSRTYDFSITIEAVGGVPEASTWAMMIFGFGLIGFAVRRRSVAAVA